MKIFIFLILAVFLFSCGESTDNENTDIDTEISDEDTQEQPLIESMTFTIPEEKTDIVTSNGLKHYAFPDIAKLENGKIMLVYRQGSGHAEDSGRILSHYSDDGVNWSDPEMIMDDNTIDDRDPSIAVLSSGRVAMNWFQYNYPTDYNEPWMHHIMFSTSESSGLNFDDSVQVDPGLFSYTTVAELNENGIWVDDQENEIKSYASSSSIIEDNGKIIIPAYGGNSLNFKAMSKTPKGPIVLFISDDDGKTWSMKPVQAKAPENTWLQEPALLKVNDKKWILQVRTALGASPSNRGELMQSVSDDDGKTWSDYKSLGVVAHAPELLLLNNGALISSFRWLDWIDAGSDIKREAVSMMYSSDNGETWSELIEIEDCGLAECGYPGMVEIENNRIIIVYYSPGGLGIRSAVITFKESYKN